MANPIEQLRTEVEQNYRFKKAFHGYDKGSVDMYIEEMKKNHEQICADMLEERESLTKKNRELLEKISHMEQEIDELNDKIEKREQTEKTIEESVVEKLKRRNEILMKENTAKELKMKEQDEKISSMRQNVETYADLLKELDKKLSKMLHSKMEECEDIIVAWEEQFDKTGSQLKEMMSEKE